MEDYKKLCPVCSKIVPFFAGKACGSCVYRKAQASQKARIEAQRRRELEQDTSGTHGDPIAADRALKAFDDFARQVREAAGGPSRVPRVPPAQHR